MPISEEHVEIPVDEGSMTTVIFRDDDDTPRPAIVFLHDAHGLHQATLDLGRALSEEGFVVAAADCYHRVGRLRNDTEPNAPADSMWLREGMTNDGHLSDMNRLAAFLLQQPYVRGEEVGVTGFCLGGRIAFLAASQGTGFGPSVPFYMTRVWQPDPAVPGSPTPLSKADVRRPMLAFFPSLDPQNPPERIDEIRRVLAGAPFEAVVVEGAEHGFVQPASPGYHPQEGPKAWRRCIDFFKEHTE